MRNSTICGMTDDEILDLLRRVPVVSGWPRHQRAWSRARVAEAGGDVTAVDAWVARVGGSVEDHQPQRTLAPYYGQTPIPTQTLYVLPRSALEV
jgi:hypothetical protein